MDTLLAAINNPGAYPSNAKDLRTHLQDLLGAEIKDAATAQEDSVALTFREAQKRRVKRSGLEKIVESNHPYNNNENVLYEVIMPGSPELIMEWDPQCRTENGCDRVTLYFDAQKTRQFGEQLTGVNFPKTPVTIPGDRVFIHFYSDGSNFDWGFRVKVSGKATKAQANATDEEPADDVTVRTLTKMGIRVLKSQAKNDPALVAGIFDDFGEMLMTRKPGSMAVMSSTIAGALGEFRGYLTQLSKDSPSPQVTVLLAALAIARGEQVDLLNMLVKLRKSEVKLPLGPSLRDWIAQKREVPAQLMTHDPIDPKVVTIEGLQFGPDSIASDGTYVYAMGHFGENKAGLFKVASGLRGTVAGAEVARREIDEAFGSFSRLFFVADKLLAVRPDGFLQWFNPVTLEPTTTGEVGSKLNLMASNSVGVFGIEVIPAPAADQPPPVLAPGEAPPFYGMIISEFVPKGEAAEGFETAKRQIKIPPAKWQRFNQETRPWTNGMEMVFADRDPPVFVSVDLRTGHTKETARDPNMEWYAQPMDRAYDAVNNVTWAVVPSRGNNSRPIHAFPNPGYYRPENPRAMSSGHNATRVKIMEEFEKLSSTDRNIDGLLASRVIAAELDHYLNAWSGVRYRCDSDPKKIVTNNPFVVDLGKDTFDIIFEVIGHFQKLPPTEDSYFNLHVALRVLNANAQMVTAYKAEASAYGVTTNLAKSYLDLLFELVELADKPGLESECADIRTLALEILTQSGLCVVFPTLQSQADTFRSLLGQDNLSPGKRAVLEGLMKSMTDVVEPMILDPSQAGEAVSMLLQVLDKAKDNAKSAFQRMPKSVASLSVAELRALAPDARSNALITLLEQSEMVLYKAKNLSIELKMKFMTAILHAGTTLLNEISIRPLDYASAKEEVRGAMAELAIAVYEHWIGDLVKYVLGDIKESPSIQLAHGLLGPISAFVQAIGSFTVSYPLTTGRGPVEKVQETMHPYNNNEDYTWTHTFPGATEIIMTFSPETYTEANCDRWKVLDGHDAQICELSGPSGSTTWPTVRIPGSTVKIMWHTDGSGTYWGVKAYMTAIAESEPTAHGFERTAVATAAALAKQLALGEPNVVGEADTKFLDSMLGAGGRLEDNDELVSKESVKLVHNILANTSNGADLFKLLRASNDTPADLKNDTHGVDIVLRASLAAFMHHTSHAPAALNYMSHEAAAGKAPPAVVWAPWAEALKCGTQYLNSGVDLSLANAAKELTQGILERATFLVTLTPAIRRVTVVGTPAAKPKVSAASRWKTAVTTAKSVNRWQFWKKAMSAGLKPKDQPDSPVVLTEVLDFLLGKSGASPASLTTAIQRATDNGHLRVKGFEALADMVRGQPSPRASAAVTNALLDLLTRDKGIRSNLAGVSSRVVGTIVRAFLSVYAALASQLAHIDSVPQADRNFLSKVVLYALSVDASDAVDDLVHTGVLGAILDFLNLLTASDNAAAAAALTAISHIVAQLVESNKAVPAQQLIDHLFSRVEKYSHGAAPVALTSIFGAPLTASLGVLLFSLARLSAENRGSIIKSMERAGRLNVLTSILYNSPDQLVQALALRVIGVVLVEAKDSGAQLTTPTGAKPAVEALLDIVKSAIAFPISRSIIGGSVKHAVHYGGRFSNALLIGEEATSVIRSLVQIDTFASSRAAFAKAFDALDDIRKYFDAHWGKESCAPMSDDLSARFLGLQAAMAVAGGGYSALRAGQPAVRFAEGNSSQRSEVVNLRSNDAFVISKTNEVCTVDPFTLLARPDVAPVELGLSGKQVLALLSLPTPPDTPNNELRAAFSAFRLLATEAADQAISSSAEVRGVLLETDLVRELVSATAECLVTSDGDLARTLLLRQVLQSRAAENWTDNNDANADKNLPPILQSTRVHSGKNGIVVEANRATPTSLLIPASFPPKIKAKPEGSYTILNVNAPNASGRLTGAYTSPTPDEEWWAFKAGRTVNAAAVKGNTAFIYVNKTDDESLGSIIADALTTLVGAEPTAIWVGGVDSADQRQSIVQDLRQANAVPAIPVVLIDDALVYGVIRELRTVAYALQLMNSGTVDRPDNLYFASSDVVNMEDAVKRLDYAKRVYETDEPERRKAWDARAATAAGTKPQVQLPSGPPSGCDNQGVAYTDQLAPGIDVLSVTGAGGEEKSHPADPLWTLCQGPHTRPFPTKVKERTVVARDTRGTAYLQYKFLITHVRGPDMSGGTQMSCFQLYAGNVDMARRPGTRSAMVTGNGSPGGEEASNLVDGNTQTKWFEPRGPGSEVVIEFSQENGPVLIDGYAYITANDCEHRDPVGWSLHGRLNAESPWVQLDTRTAVSTIPTGRFSQTEVFKIPGHSAGGNGAPVTASTNSTDDAATSSPPGDAAPTPAPAAPDTPGRPVQYREYEFCVKRARDDLNADAVQITGIKLMQGDLDLAQPLGQRCYSDVTSPAGEDASNAINGNNDTKWLGHGFGPYHECSLFVVFGEPTELTHYAYITGNDCPGRDPIEWFVRGRNQDSEPFVELDHRVMASDQITQERKADTQAFNFPVAGAAPAAGAAGAAAGAGSNAGTQAADIDVRRTAVANDPLYLASLANDRLEVYARKAVLGRLLANQPKDKMISGEKLGDAKGVADFIYSLLKGGSPMSYVANPSPSHALSAAVTAVEHLMAAPDAKAVRGHVFNWARQGLTSEGDGRGAGLLLVRLLGPYFNEISSEDMGSLVEALLATIWAVRVMIVRVIAIRTLQIVLSCVKPDSLSDSVMLLLQELGTGTALNMGANPVLPYYTQACLEIGAAMLAINAARSGTPMPATNANASEPNAAAVSAAIRLALVSNMLNALAAESLTVMSQPQLEFILAPPVTDRVVVETNHPYECNLDTTWTVNFPGATSITITVDPQSRTEANYDHLTVYADESRSSTIAGPFTGSTMNLTTTLERSSCFCVFHSDGSGVEWGIKAVFTPNGLAPRGEAPSVSDILAKFYGWTLAKDHQLVELINTVADKNRLESHWGDNNFVDLVLSDLDNSPLKGTAIDVVRQRLALLDAFNNLVLLALPQMDLGNCMGAPTSIAGRLYAMRALVYNAIKARFVDVTLHANNTGDGMPEVTISRFRASKAAEAGKFEGTLFEQIYHELLPMSTNALRQAERAYKVNFRGEGSVDAGGPYRESVSQMVTELQADFGLFALVPNGTLAVGLNRETRVPKPSMNSQQQLGWFRFVGIMMGVALRTRGVMELNLPPLVWKGLLGRPLNAADLEQIDATTFKTLDSLRNIDKEGITAETFGDIFFETFTTHLADGSEVPLVPGGASKPLTFANRQEYCDLTLNMHLHAYDAQLAAMREGMLKIVPLIAIDALLTPAMLEIMVAGKPTMDVDLLRSQTEYDSCSATDEHVGYLFNVLRSYNPTEQALFLRFVWGRSRLPTTASGFSKKMKIAGSGRPNPDAHMPETHTCFFQIDLPRYSSEAILRRQLTYAIHNCTAIDADSDAVDRSDWQ